MKSSKTRIDAEIKQLLKNKYDLLSKKVLITKCTQLRKISGQSVASGEDCHPAGGLGRYKK